MVVAKDSRVAGHIHYGRSGVSRFRARVYTFLDHPRYHKRYLFYLPALSYHVVLYLTLCVAGLVQELTHFTWIRAFAYEKWGIADFDAHWLSLRIGQTGAAVLVVEYALRVWSCVANSKYGGDHKVINPATIRANYRAGRRRYMLEWMNLLELVITIATATAYFVWTPSLHLRFVIFARAIHWDKSVHAVRLIVQITTKGFRYIVPCWAFAFILMALHSCAVFQCELYYRLDNDTVTDSDIADLGDALWFTYVTSMSIGYGDFTPKTGFCRGLSVVFGYCSNGLLFSVQTAVSLFLVKHIAEEANARQDKKVQNIAAKVIQSWARFHLARRKSPAMDKFTEICCQKLFRAKQKIEQQRRLAGLMLPARRLIKRAKRTSALSVRAKADAASASPYAQPPHPSALVRKRGSLPNHLHGLFSMTAATAAVFGTNRSGSHETDPLSPPSEHDYSASNQHTVDERFLRKHGMDRGASGVSSFSRCKTTREEFGPLVIMIQFLLFGHFKRRFRNTEFRRPPEKKVAEEQEKLAASVKEVEKKFEKLVKQHEHHDTADEGLESVIDRLCASLEQLTEKVHSAEAMVELCVQRQQPLQQQLQLQLQPAQLSPTERKRKMTVAEPTGTAERKDSEEQVPKRKHTIL